MAQTHKQTHRRILQLAGLPYAGFSLNLHFRSVTYRHYWLKCRFSENPAYGRPLRCMYYGPSTVHCAMAQVQCNIVPVNRAIAPVQLCKASVQCALAPVQLGKVSVQFAMAPVQCAMAPVQCAMAPIQCAMAPVQCAMAPVQRAMAPVQCAMAPVQCDMAPVQCAIASVKPAIDPVHCSVGWPSRVCYGPSTGWPGPAYCGPSTVSHGTSTPITLYSIEAGQKAALHMDSLHTLCIFSTFSVHTLYILCSSIFSSAG